MKKTVLVLAVVVSALSLVSVSAMAGKGEKKEGAKKKEGVVAVNGALVIATNDAGKVISAVITAKDGKVYNVVMDGFTQDLSALTGKTVHTKGEVKDVDGKEMLTVKGEIKEVAEKKEAKAKGKGKGKGKKGAEVAPEAPAPAPAAQ